ncbi:NAD(P)H-dependent oxidoreductase [Luteibaculum oceani]|uniref:NAD(P)H-dependent oxidoreductase n=1 Tax=Luteibaculum oceani TaxID=1294296 RepID=A0A5C6UU03_9FLAO|nr:NAD(P)H-dependent oxidoreductase [Luteibaculum oceani]TXC76070.1 NAD(P)H-dependent oxidoreductase [Luteibaculum oceani]
MELLKDWKWRYATKKFDTEKKISNEDLQNLKEAIQLAPSSYGLQPFKVLIVDDPEVREKLSPVSWNQPQITEASHLFVFAAKTGMDKDYIEKFIELRADKQGKSKEELQAYGDFIFNSIKDKSNEELTHWNSRQVYIALSNLLTACANQRIDACPMEGFDNNAYNKILGLEEHGLHAVAVVAVGYRSSEDSYADLEKVRFPEEVLFETV